MARVHPVARPREDPRAALARPSQRVVEAADAVPAVAIRLEDELVRRSLARPALVRLEQVGEHTAALVRHRYRHLVRFVVQVVDADEGVAAPAVEEGNGLAAARR